MAEQLVGSLAAPFEPERYPDEHRERVLELLERKAEGETIEAPEPERAPAEVVSLADALSASLAAARRRGGDTARTSEPRRSQAGEAPPARRGGTPRRRRSRREEAAKAVKRARRGARSRSRSTGRASSSRTSTRSSTPQAGFTKGEVIDYYARIAPGAPPHLRDRPLTLKRYPEGVDGDVLLREALPAPPAEVVPHRAGLERGQRRVHRLLRRERPASLVWAANIADLELHASLSLARAIDTPTLLVFDLDPGPPADVVTCCEVALSFGACSIGSTSRRSRRPPGRRACRCTCRSTCR